MNVIDLQQLTTENLIHDQSAWRLIASISLLNLRLEAWNYQQGALRGTEVLYGACATFHCLLLFLMRMRFSTTKIYDQQELRQTLRVGHLWDGQPFWSAYVWSNGQPWSRDAGEISISNFFCCCWRPLLWFDALRQQHPEKRRTLQRSTYRVHTGSLPSPNSSAYVFDDSYITTTNRTVLYVATSTCLEHKLGYILELWRIQSSRLPLISVPGTWSWLDIQQPCTVISSCSDNNCSRKTTVSVTFSDDAVWLKSSRQSHQT